MNAQIERHDTDILILGSGGAGLFAALHAQQSAPAGTKITLAVKGLIGKCGCTRMVQGGYNVALGGGDTVERHFMDTINGGKWLPDQDMAWRLCETAVERIHELENEVGCFFDRNHDGSLHQKAFAGQTADRTVHKGDLTGIEIINRLMEQVLSRPVERLQEHRAIALVPSRDGEGLAGVLMIDMRTGSFRMVRAKAVLMATGGGPTMYRYHTPSGDKTMDGLSMALRAGLPLRDMEMVQFHPTGLLAGDNTRMTGTVLEEGLRGAGGASSGSGVAPGTLAFSRSRSTVNTVQPCSTRWRATVPPTAPQPCTRARPGRASLRALSRTASTAPRVPWAVEALASTGLPTAASTWGVSAVRRSMSSRLVLRSQPVIMAPSSDSSSSAVTLINSSLTASGSAARATILPPAKPVP